MKEAGASTSRVVLALDFDGVLHPVKSRTEPVFCRLELLEGWLRKHDQVDLLIASSWRAVHPFDEMVSYFEPDLQGRVIGATPFFHQLYDLDDRRDAELLETAGCKRQVEVEAWLAKERPGARWLALDDEPGNYRPGCRSLVVCDSSTGLTRERLRELSRVLMEGRLEPCSDRQRTSL